jgi:hypothetical protein
MSTHILLPPVADQHDEDILRMMDVGEYAELNDFLGEILHPEISPDQLSSSMTDLETTPATSHYPLQYQQQQQQQQQESKPISPLTSSPSLVSSTTVQQPLHNAIPSAPSEPSIRVSPAPSITSSGDSSGDDSSTSVEDGIPHTVTTGPFSHDDTFLDGHRQNQLAATSSTDDVVATKKIRRRYVE